MNQDAQTIILLKAELYDANSKAAQLSSQVEEGQQVLIKAAKYFGLDLSKPIQLQDIADAIPSPEPAKPKLEEVNTPE